MRWFSGAKIFSFPLRKGRERRRQAIVGGSILFIRHPDEGRDPLPPSDLSFMPVAQWIPACAGMTNNNKKPPDWAV